VGVDLRSRPAAEGRAGGAACGSGGAECPRFSSPAAELRGRPVRHAGTTNNTNLPRVYPAGSSTAGARASGVEESRRAGGGKSNKPYVQALRVTAAWPVAHQQVSWITANETNVVRGPVIAFHQLEHVLHILVARFNRETESHTVLRKCFSRALQNVDLLAWERFPILVFAWAHQRRVRFAASDM
jgi:hypothetical protein